MSQSLTTLILRFTIQLLTIFIFLTYRYELNSQHHLNHYHGQKPVLFGVATEAATSDQLSSTASNLCSLLPNYLANQLKICQLRRGPTIQGNTSAQATSAPFIRGIGINQEQSQPQKQQQPQPQQQQQQVPSGLASSPTIRTRDRRQLIDNGGAIVDQLPQIVRVSLERRSFQEAPEGSPASSLKDPFLESQSSFQNSPTSSDQLVAYGGSAVAVLRDDPSPSSSRSTRQPVDSDIFNESDSLQQQQQQQQMRQQQQRNKLYDYIIDFLTKNNLHRFCDLLAQSSNISQQLELMDRYTLFVPTDEAFLLLPSSLLEHIKTDQRQLNNLLESHISDELIPLKGNKRLQQVIGSSMYSQLAHLPQVEPHLGASPPMLARSLNRYPMRITVQSLDGASINGSINGYNNAATTTTTNNNNNNLNPFVSSGSSRIIINGANIVRGYSYLLQSVLPPLSNNNNTTTSTNSNQQATSLQGAYAVVHVIDKVLYPPPINDLMSKIRQVAPQMASFIEMSGLSDQLTSINDHQQQLFTVFVPNDEAFRGTPGSLMDQMAKNRTFLAMVIENHLMPGLHYSGALAGTQSMSLAQQHLKFTEKSIQSRQLVLVNSIPIIDPDLVALNGVVHVITRPILPKHLIEACKCEKYLQQQQQQQWPTPPSLLPAASSPLVDNQLGSGTSNDPLSIQPQASNIQSNRVPLVVAVSTRNNDTLASQENLRVQRADSSLISQNNRNFYRPSTSPNNLSQQPLTNRQQQLANNINQLESFNGQPTTTNGQVIVTKGQLLAQLQQQPLNNNNIEVAPADFRYQTIIGANREPQQFNQDFQPTHHQQQQQLIRQQQLAQAKHQINNNNNNLNWTTSSTFGSSKNETGSSTLKGHPYRVYLWDPSTLAHNLNNTTQFMNQQQQQQQDISDQQQASGRSSGSGSGIKIATDAAQFVDYVPVPNDRSIPTYQPIRTTNSNAAGGHFINGSSSSLIVNGSGQDGPLASYNRIINATTRQHHHHHHQQQQQQQQQRQQVLSRPPEYHFIYDRPLASSTGGFPSSSSTMMNTTGGRFVWPTNPNSIWGESNTNTNPLINSSNSSSSSHQSIPVGIAPTSGTSITGSQKLIKFSPQDAKHIVYSTMVVPSSDSTSSSSGIINSGDQFNPHQHQFSLLESGRLKTVSPSSSQVAGSSDEFVTLAPPTFSSDNNLNSRLSSPITNSHPSSSQVHQQQPSRISGASGFAVAILHNHNESLSSHYDIVSTASSIASHDLSNGSGNPSFATKTSKTTSTNGFDSGSPKSGLTLGQQQQQQQLSTGCAFYDTECRRQQQKLVKGGSVSGGLLMVSSTTTTPSSLLAPSLTATGGGGGGDEWASTQQQQQQTFGLQGEDRPTQWLTAINSAGSPIIMRQANGGVKISPLAQPLPPWGDDENQALFISPSLASDIARIRRPNIPTAAEMDAFVSGPSYLLARQNTNQTSVFVSPPPPPSLLANHHSSLGIKSISGNQQQQQHKTMFLPNSGLLGRLVQLTTPSSLINRINISSNVATQAPPFRQSNFTPTVFAGQRITPMTPSSMNANLKFFSPIIMRQQQQQQQQQQQPTINQQFSPMLATTTTNGTSTTHVPTMFQNLQVATNGGQREFDSSNGGATGGQKQAASQLKQRPPVQVISSQFPRPPSSHRKQRLQQIQIDNNGSLGANFDLNPANGNKQSRKLVQLQTSPPNVAAGTRLHHYHGATGGVSSDSILAATTGDSSTVMAGQQLNKLHPIQKQQLQQQQQVESPAISQQLLNNQQQQQQQHANIRSASSSEYFQNRSIADIMDDSGLRLDGQMVTFAKLKDCLVESGLLSLIMQSTNPITIFMPTDQAFQRLVHYQQQQMASMGASQSALMQQQSSFVPMKRSMSSSASPSLSVGDPFSRLSSSSTSLSASGSGQSSTTISQQHDPNMMIDCSSVQARQLLLDHLSVKLMTPKELMQDVIIPSVSNRNLILSSIPDKKIVVIDGQPVVAATRAKNGMVYVVNKFLNISQQLPSVVDVINQQKNLSTFSSYLRFSGIEPQLRRDSGPITILAPTNDAFDQLSSKARAALNSDPAALLDIIKGHIVDGAQFGKLISMRVQLRTLNSDQIIDAKNIRPNVYLLDNQATTIRLVGSSANGVVNAIDRIIIPRWLRETFKQAEAWNDTTTINSVGTRLSSNSNIGGRGGGSREVESADLIRNGGGRFETASTSLSDYGPNISDGFDSRVVGNATGEANTISSVSFDSSLHPTTLPGDVDVFLRPNASSSTRTLSANSPANIIDRTNGSSRNMRLIEKLANMLSANKFVKLLHRANSERLLKQQATNYVILVPTDQAIEKLPRQIIQMLEKNNQKLEDLVNYHILETTFEYINMIPDGQTLNTINDKDIVFNWYRGNTILTASGSVVLGGVQEDNIAVLIVDRVLYPTPGDIMEIISKSPILSNLTRMVRNTGLEQQLSKSGPFTLFAPSDSALNRMNSNDIEFLNRNRDAARRFLLKHLSQPTVFTSAVALSNTTSTLPSGQIAPKLSITNLLGEELILRQMNDYFSVKDVNFSYSDVAATNGVIHVIDGIL